MLALQLTVRCRGLLLFFASLLPYSIAAMLLPESLLAAPRRTPEHDHTKIELARSRGAFAFLECG